MRHKFAAARQLGLRTLYTRLLWRLRQLVRIVAFHAWHKGRSGIFSKAAIDQLGSAPIRSFLPDFDCVREKYSQDDSRVRESRRRIIDTADRVCGDMLELRGIGAVQLRMTAANWYDYDRGAAIMINRHDFLIHLVQAHVLTTDAKYALKINKLFTYWIDNFGLALLKECDTPIDAAIRLINWAWVFNCKALKLDAKRQRKLLEIIFLQAEYIYAWHSAGGNHLVLEALSHAVYGAMFPSCGRARKWSAWGRNTLFTELVRQTGTDGVHSEQSMFYHQAVTTHFLKFYLASESEGRSWSSVHRQRLLAMLDFVHDTAKPNGRHPVLGDGEELLTDDREHWEARALLAARWRLFGKPVNGLLARTIAMSSAWLMGVSPDEVETSLEPIPSALFADSGLAVLRAGDAYALFDAAPFSDPAFPHHGHADALSVEVCVGDDDLFVDPGGYGYYDDAYRQFFRSTAAHNTVTIRDCDQSEVFGVLGYGRLANAFVHYFVQDDSCDRVAASHDGYLPSAHRRDVLLCKQPHRLLIVLDQIRSAGGHRVVARWHAPPNLRIDLDTSRLLTASGKEFSVHAAASQPNNQRVVRGRFDGQLQGWTSPETKRAVPADTWEIDIGACDDCRIVTVIGLDCAVPVSTQILESGDFSVTVAGADYRLSVHGDAVELKSIKGVTEVDVIGSAKCQNRIPS